MSIPLWAICQRFSWQMRTACYSTFLWKNFAMWTFSENHTTLLVSYPLPPPWINSELQKKYLIAHPHPLDWMLDCPEVIDIKGARDSRPIFTLTTLRLCLQFHFTFLISFPPISKTIVKTVLDKQGLQWTVFIQIRFFVIAYKGFMITSVICSIHVSFGITIIFWFSINWAKCFIDTYCTFFFLFL